MVVAPPPRITVVKPAAHVAVETGLWIAFLGLSLIANFFEPRFYISVVCSIFRNPVGLRFETLSGRNHIHKFWFIALNLGQKF
jgi:hypothetical protein